MDLDIMQWLIFGTFIIGFFLIAFGSKFIDNLLASFLTAVLCWLLIGVKYFISNQHFDTDKFYHLLGDTTNIVFFLIFALLIVEIVRSHNGFDKLTALFKQFSSKEIPNKLSFNHLLWIVTLTSFFLASVIDNVTAALIITVAISRLIRDKEDLYFLAFFGGAVGANAGGTFSPIGEITTTQLWAGGQITFVNTVKELFIPSLISIIMPLCIYSLINSKKYINVLINDNQLETRIPIKHTRIIIFTAFIAMLFVIPILKGYLGLPPMIGAVTAFCMLWLVVMFLQKQTIKINKQLTADQTFVVIDIKGAFLKIEWETPLFFLGILLAVAALKQEHILQNLGTYIQYHIKDLPLHQPLMAFIIGLVSAVMDNVALVATVQGMYPITIQGYESNNLFWFLLSFCAGTGGSLLVVGSAAGVAVRNKLEADFGGSEINLNNWFIKNVTLWAAINYVTGFLICLLKYIF